MEVWCSAWPDVLYPGNLVAPGLHLLPRSAVICALAPRISARRRAPNGTLDVVREPRRCAGARPSWAETGPKLVPVQCLLTRSPRACEPWRERVWRLSSAAADAEEGDAAVRATSTGSAASARRATPGTSSSTALAGSRRTDAGAGLTACGPTSDRAATGSTRSSGLDRPGGGAALLRARVRGEQGPILGVDGRGRGEQVVDGRCSEAAAATHRVLHGGIARAHERPVADHHVSVRVDLLDSVGDGGLRRRQPRQPLIGVGKQSVGITARSPTSVRLIHEPQRISLAADAGVSEDTRALHVGVTCA